MNFRSILLLFAAACSMELPQIPGMGPNTPLSVCGDGITERGEACDDGNSVDFDACTNACTNAGCGDGITRRDLTDPLTPGYEACDDGNDRDDDGCTNACRSPKCGDGRIFQNTGAGSEGYEECDDGNTSSRDGCTVQCTVARCGDGFLHTQTEAGESIEECDDGNAVDVDGCRNNCQIARCGDGVTRADVAPGIQGDCSSDADCDQTQQCVYGRCYPLGFERCDDGNDDPTDGCLNECVSARCGDGIIRTDLAEGDTGYEACDDGNTVDTDGCTSDCKLAQCGDGVRRTDLDSRVRGPTALCSNECWDQETCIGAICLPIGYEACDDGNLNNSDACVQCQHPGASASSAARSCLQLLNQGQTESGIYWLDFDGIDGPFEAKPFYCDQTTNGGGWIGAFGPNTVSDACEWVRFSYFDYFDSDRSNETVFNPVTDEGCTHDCSFEYQCGSYGFIFEHIAGTRIELRLTIDTPFAFSSVRYSGQLQVAADSGTQLYMLPQPIRRHPRAQLEPPWDWQEVESCEPITLNESTNLGADQSSPNSMSLLLRGYSPGNGCPNDSIVRFNTLWLR